MNAQEEELKTQVPIDSVFHHYKGKRYKILAIGRHHEDLEYQVVYQGLYHSEEFGDGPIWVRPLKMFLETIEVEGKKIPRFRRE
ncbi:MAG: DUF1653 domain-containing protein [Chlamydiae bacterium]|nr:DUF1653 domain-containing protein [Chlamydiota bacterium]